MTQILAVEIMSFDTQLDVAFHNFLALRCAIKGHILCLFVKWVNGAVDHLMLHVLPFYFQKHSCQNSLNDHKFQNPCACNLSCYSITVCLDKAAGDWFLPEGEMRM
jgi:fumarate reductase subunit D